MFMPSRGREDMLRVADLVDRSFLLLNVFVAAKHIDTSMQHYQETGVGQRSSTTMKQNLGFVSPRNFPRKRYPRYGSAMSGYWSPKLPNTKDCAKTLAWCRSKVALLWNTWSSVVLCNDWWDPDYPVGCAHTQRACQEVQVRPPHFRQDSMLRHGHARSLQRVRKGEIGAVWQRVDKRDLVQITTPICLMVPCVATLTIYLRQCHWKQIGI